MNTNAPNTPNTTGDKKPPYKKQKKQSPAPPPEKAAEREAPEEIFDHDAYAKFLKAEEPEPTTEIIALRFKAVGKIYFFSPEGEQFSVGERIIVETARGQELGYVVIANKYVSSTKVVHPLKPILRRATEQDMENAEKNRRAAKETIKTASERIRFHNLDEMKMKLIDAEYTFDNSKLIYYFTAEGRVDFRELVKDLGSVFRTRIEMRQIQVRDQTKIVGGLSVCGRPF
ncbi:MAG: PSP1 domain-containing protein, partial [Oscillospiraceae bacterium]|nr:PSP1 domain-containing protein [Oscillospiraceae bacterium]